MYPIIFAGLFAVIGYGLGKRIEKDEEKSLTAGMNVDTSNNNTNSEPPVNEPAEEIKPESETEKTE
jgi:hypothetical protein